MRRNWRKARAWVHGLPPRSRWGILAGWLLAVAGAFFLASWQPHAMRMAALREAIAKARADREALEAERARFRNLEGETKALRERVAAVARRVPAEAEPTALTDAFTRLVRGVRIEDIRYSPECEEGACRALPFKVTLAGTARDVCAYLEALGGLEQLTEIRGLDVAAAGAPGRVRAELYGYAYAAKKGPSQSGSAGPRSSESAPGMEGAR